MAKVQPAPFRAGPRPIHAPRRDSRSRSGKSRNTGPIVTSATPASSGQATICHAATASSPVTLQAMSNAWLKEQGLLSCKDLWCKA